MTIQAEQFMQKALDLAEKGLGRTAPNPPVGAVLVRDGLIVGQGFHPASGQPHAEIFALQEAGSLASGGDLYVTLEPCCHQGRTGPCTEEVIAAGVARVFVGTQDPNPLVAGQGLKRLRKAGLEVVCGVLEQKCQQLIKPFAKYIESNLPYVVFKAAMTLDGQIATTGGDSKWISCPESRELVHRLRDQVDGIMVGSGTVQNDDPQLTTRLESGGRDPVRIVLDGSLKTSPHAKVYSQRSKAKTILVTALEHAEEALQPYRSNGVEILQVGQRANSLDLPAVLLELGKRNLHYLLLEGGSVLAGAMMRAGLVDRIMVFVAPKVFAGAGRSLMSGKGPASIAEACTLTNFQARPVGTDILIEGEVHNVHRTD